MKLQLFNLRAEVRDQVSDLAVFCPLIYISSEEINREQNIFYILNLGFKDCFEVTTNSFDTYAFVTVMV